MKYQNEMTLTIKALSQNESFARSCISAFFAQLNPTLEQIDDLKTAVSEAVTNCIVHGYEKGKGKIELWAGLSEDTIYVKITDYGRGIEDIAKARQPFFTTIENERSGMGFTVMEAFCDRVEVFSKTGLTTVTLVKSVPSKQEK